MAIYVGAHKVWRSLLLLLLLHRIPYNNVYQEIVHFRMNYRSFAIIQLLIVMN